MLGSRLLPLFVDPHRFAILASGFLALNVGSLGLLCELDAKALAKILPPPSAETSKPTLESYGLSVDVLRVEASKDKSA
jgi:hypothetical protein